jgi:predicted DNA-binding transcriptional regulator AlpA
VAPKPVPACRNPFKPCSSCRGPAIKLRGFLFNQLKTTKPKVEKPTYRQEIKEQTLDKRWGRMPDTVKLTGLSRSEIYRLITEGLIQSFVYTFHEGAKSGVRLIDLKSLAVYLDQRAEEALAAQSRGES